MLDILQNVIKYAGVFKSCKRRAAKSAPRRITRVQNIIRRIQYKAGAEWLVGRTLANKRNARDFLAATAPRAKLTYKLNAAAADCMCVRIVLFESKPQK